MTGAAGAPEFSLVEGDPLYRAQRALRLIPGRGHGIVRRWLAIVAVGWLPFVVWERLSRHAPSRDGAEPLLQHFGVHARFLLAIPLLLLAEPLAQAVGRRIVGYFLSSGLVSPAERPAFLGIVEGTRRLLRSRLALAGIVVLALANAAVASRDIIQLHEVYWARAGGTETPSASAPGGTSGVAARLDGIVRGADPRPLPGAVARVRAPAGRAQAAERPCCP